MDHAARNWPPMPGGKMRFVGIPDYPQPRCQGGRDTAGNRVMAAGMDEHGFCLRQRVHSPGNPLDGGVKHTGFNEAAGNSGLPE